MLLTGVNRLYIGGGEIGVGGLRGGEGSLPSAETGEEGGVCNVVGVWGKAPGGVDRLDRVRFII